MTDQYVPALRQRFLEDMQIKGLQPKTQTMYLRGMRDFTRFLGRSPDTATPEDLRAFQLDMKERGVGAPTFNNRLTVLSFFFAATCPRPEMKAHMRYQRAAKKIPIVLSAEEVVRILEVAPGPGLKYRAAFSVAYGGGLRASEVTHLKIGDIDSDRMLIRALKMAIAFRAPPRGCIHHTDRGSQYCSHDYQKILRQHGFSVSMSGKGNCYDNAAVETFFKTIKAELIWRDTWETRRKAEMAIFEYINGFYNPRRRHSALGWKSPVAFERKVA